MQQRKISVVCRILVILFCLFSSGIADIEIHYLDVGQGDSAIVLCDGESMMIDGGQPARSQFIFSYLQNMLKLNRLDYIVATHPDADHIGGLSAALNACEAGALYSSTDCGDTNAFQSLMKYLAKRELKPIVPTAGDSFHLGNAQVEIVAPVCEYPDENNASIVLKITYGKVSFLFTGDIEAPAETDILSGGAIIESTVLKIAHHGSDTSSSDRFLDAVQPQYAVISVGDNAYGHPSERVLDRLKSRGIALYRTDTNGTIICRSDGDRLSFAVEREDTIAVAPGKIAEEAAPYIGNRNSKKFHKTGCSSIDDMKDKNKVIFDSRNSAIDAGYVPCKRCKP